MNNPVLINWCQMEKSVRVEINVPEVINLIKGV